MRLFEVEQSQEYRNYWEIFKKDILTFKSFLEQGNLPRLLTKNNITVGYWKPEEIGFQGPLNNTKVIIRKLSNKKVGMGFIAELNAIVINSDPTKLSSKKLKKWANHEGFISKFYHEALHTIDTEPYYNVSSDEEIDYKSYFKNHNEVRAFTGQFTKYLLEVLDDVQKLPTNKRKNFLKSKGIHIDSINRTIFSWLRIHGFLNYLNLFFNLKEYMKVEDFKKFKNILEEIFDELKKSVNE